MRSRLVAAVAALLTLVPIACGQDRKEARKSRAERQAQVEELVQDFLKARKEAGEAFQAARTDRERAAAEAKLPREADFLPRIHKLIAGDAKDDAAGEALSLAVFGFQTKDEKVYDALARNFVKTDRIQRFVEMAYKNGAPDAAKPVLANVLAENPSKVVKGMACFALGKIAFEKDDAKADKEAEVYFPRVEKEFADVTVGPDEILGEMATGSLFELRNLRVGMKAPAAESTTLRGEKATLADYLGKVVVLDFWATWCIPCKEMIPHEREMVEKFKDKPFVLSSVSADEQKKELEEFLGKVPMPWMHWWDGPGAQFVKQWNVHNFPTIYVIDAKGVIRYKNIRGDELEKAVEKLLAEAK